MNPFKSISTALVCAILMGGCMLDSDKPSQPEPLEAEPELVHTKTNLVLTPGETFTESLFVKHAGSVAWTVSLVSAPSGTTILNGLIRYDIPTGLTGLLEVHAIAFDGSGKILNLVWTVTALPNTNRPPVFEFGAVPQWIVAGQTFRILIKITDPDQDPLTLNNSFPEGAVLHDSILEWTPATNQVGDIRRFLFNVYDTHGHHVNFDFALTVLSFDPKAYGAEMRVGRVFWMRGFMKMESATRNDSIYFRRSIRITQVDSANGTFSYTAKDTLSGSLDSIGTVSGSDTLRLSRSFAFNFTIPLPFDLPKDEPAFETTSFVLQGKEYSALHQISPNTCLNGTGTKYGCGGYESTFVKGLGRVLMKEEGRSNFSATDSKGGYEIWAVSEP
ncbi:MAG: hypothetical protein ABIW76_01605 [Fibrobacteria bacterium]